MKHLAVIQSEFIKIAKIDYLWEQMSGRAQREYLKDHAESDRRPTKPIDDSGKNVFDRRNKPIQQPAIVSRHGVPIELVRKYTLPNNSYGMIIVNSNDKKFLKKWKELVKKYNLEEQAANYRYYDTKEGERLQYKEKFRQAVGEFEDSITDEDAGKLLDSFGSKVHPDVKEKLLDARQNESALTIFKKIRDGLDKFSKDTQNIQGTIAGATALTYAILRLFH